MAYGELVMACRKAESSTSLEISPELPIVAEQVYIEVVGPLHADEKGPI